MIEDRELTANTEADPRRVEFEPPAKGTPAASLHGEARQGENRQPEARQSETRQPGAHQSGTHQSDIRQPGAKPASTSASGKIVLTALILVAVLGAGIYFYPNIKALIDSKQAGADKVGSASSGKAGGADKVGGGKTADGKPGDPKKDKVYPVTVAVSTVASVPIEIRSIGNVQPSSIVNITPQVSGQLIKVHFTQGELVQKGQLLFEIDPRPYQAAVDQMQGNVERDAAQVEAARANMNKDIAQVGLLKANMDKDKAQSNYADTQNGRYSQLLEQGAVSREQSDQMSTNSKSASATIQADLKAIENAQAVVQSDKAAINTALGTLKADKGVLENAKVQLSWTTIRAPITGRTGTLNVYEGNVVTANTSQALVTIAQVNPIFITVTVPEQYLADLRRTMKDGTLKMQALVEGAKASAVDGTISFMDNTVNMSTGTIYMRATFPNADHTLYPGQFVDIITAMPPAGATVVVPTRAIQTTQKGNAVYVVQKDGTVKLAMVELGAAAKDVTAIKSGLAAGETVVTDGQLQLTDGAKVKIVKDSQDKNSLNGGSNNGLPQGSSN